MNGDVELTANILIYNQSLPGTSIMQEIRFRTEIPLPRYGFNIEHHHKILTMGSCFATNLADRLRRFRFDVSDNPFGVLYNPVSVSNAMDIIQSERQFAKEDLTFHDEQWHSFYHHSDFSHPDADHCLATINEGLRKARQFLTSADILIVTYGTAYVYRYIKTGQIVSNCHKIPAGQFEHYRLSFEEIRDSIRKTVETAHKLNPKVRIVFSVSPIRYLKEGFIQNQLSKAVLLLAVNDVSDKNDRCIYFPAYEILMDDLRDYRFYEANLTHPNAIAVDYIWQVFSRSFFSKSCFGIMEKVKKVVQAYEHRPRNPQTGKHKQFILKQLNFAEQLQKEYPHLKLRKETDYFRELLSTIEKDHFNL